MQRDVYFKQTHFVTQKYTVPSVRLGNLNGLALTKLNRFRQLRFSFAGIMSEEAVLP